MHHPDPERRQRGTAQCLGVRVMVARGRVAGLAPLVDVWMRVVHTLVAVRMDVEVALRPAEQQPERKEDDHQTDGHLCAPDQPVRQVPPEQDHRQPEGQQCGGMAEPPRQAKCSGPTCAVPLVRQDEGRDRREVVRVGGVPEAQQKGHRQRHQSVTTERRQSIRPVRTWRSKSSSVRDRSEITSPGRPVGLTSTHGHEPFGRFSSAYLQSASHQPIHWYPWGPEAFAAAQAADKPVLLDIGAVWCHWCHVMDGESYENPELAGFLNEHFVCIKVDRDERPDVDARYQRAVQTLTQQGGWPLTAFLNPKGEVFFGGTYFPPDGQYGRPGFRSVLASVLDAYRARPDQVQAQAQAIRRVLEEHLDESAPGEVGPETLDAAVDQMVRVFDPINGGFGSQPKFPHPGALTLLLHRWYDQPSEQIRTVIDRTLQGMARGGMYDQLAGGFHRYSVDARWIVPHFEKMSYDNSELLKAYLDAYALFGNEEYAEVARGIVRWVREVMADPEGATPQARTPMWDSTTTATTSPGPATRPPRS